VGLSVIDASPHANSGSTSAEIGYAGVDGDAQAASPTKSILPPGELRVVDSSQQSTACRVVNCDGTGVAAAHGSATFRSRRAVTLQAHFAEVGHHMICPACKEIC
jgi:hypothetical protein